MDRESIERRAGDPHLVSGIYNYCDCWCERCTFTSRCLSYQLGAEAREPHGDREPSDRGWAAEVTASLEVAAALLEEIAEEQGIDLSADPEPAGGGPVLERIPDAAQVEGLVRAALDYARGVDAWFQEAEAALEAKREALARVQRMELPGANPAGEALAIQDAMEVARWYQHFICFKLLRAVTGVPEEEVPAGEVLSDDANGSAKVALLAMDRSIAAWTTLLGSFPEQEGGILERLVALERLRRRTEREFPGARRFRRPGFDVPDASG